MVAQYATSKYDTLAYWLFWAIALEKQQMQGEAFSEFPLTS